MDAKQELTPGGKLRVGLNYGNFLLVLKDAPDGSPRGIALDLGRELGKRDSGVPVEFVKFKQAGQLADGVRDESATSASWAPSRSAPMRSRSPRRTSRSR